MVNIKKKAQTWSIDVVLGVILFLSAFFIFYSLLSQSFNTKANNLKQDASSVINDVSSGDSLLRVIDNNEVNISKIIILKKISYDELKSKFRIEGDFCIYIEDEKGNVVLINNTYKSIGAPTINLSGIPCSQP